MAEISDAAMQALVEETFAAGQDQMRNRAALRAFNAIGIESGGEDMRLAQAVSEFILGMKIKTLAEGKSRISEAGKDVSGG